MGFDRICSSEFSECPSSSFKSFNSAWLWGFIYMAILYMRPDEVAVQMFHAICKQACSTWPEIHCILQQILPIIAV